MNQRRVMERWNPLTLSWDKFVEERRKPMAIQVTEDVKHAAEIFNDHVRQCIECSSPDPRQMCDMGLRMLLMFQDAIVAMPEV